MTLNTRVKRLWAETINQSNPSSLSWLLTVLCHRDEKQTPSAPFPKAVWVTLWQHSISPNYCLSSSGLLPCHMFTSLK